MKTKTLAIGLGAAAAIAAAAIFNLLPTPAESDSQKSSEPAAFAKSLSGTQPAGFLRDEGGELVLNRGLIERFDYYLSTIGERSQAEIKAEIESRLDKELPPKAAAEAKRLFGRYLDFKLALRAMSPDTAYAPGGTVIETLRNRQTAMQAMRARYFSPDEVTALFGANDTIDNDAFARADIQGNPNLTASEKKAKLAELDARLPAEVRAGRAADAKHHSLVDAEKEARAQGASEAQLLQIRSELVGVEVARKLADFDKEEAAWKQRIDAYLVERKNLLSFAGMAEVDREAAVNKLRERSFNAQERLRLGAYE